MKKIFFQESIKNLITISFSYDSTLHYLVVVLILQTNSREKPKIIKTKKGLKISYNKDHDR